MLKKISKLFCLVLIVTLVFCSCGGQSGDQNGGGGAETEPVTLYMSFTLPPNTPCDLAAQRFKELVEERSEGRILVEIFPSNGLSGGDNAKSLEMTVAGDIDIHGGSPATVSSFDSRFYAFWIPWLLDDLDAFYKMYDMDSPVMQEVAKWSEEKGLKLFGCGYSGGRQVTNNKREIRTIEDLKGLTIRVPNIGMFVDLYKALGANPITMSFTEVYTACQQGTIDGQENAHSTFASVSLQDVQKYITAWDYVLDPTIFFFNPDKFNSFSAEDQELLTSCMEEAMKYNDELTIEGDKVYEEEFEKAGVKVTHLTEEELAPFKEVAAEVASNYRSEIGEEAYDLFMDYAEEANK